MSGQFNNSPRGEDKDVEAGTRSFTDYEDSPFDIASTKNAPVERLRRWRVIAFIPVLYVKCILNFLSCSSHCSCDLDEFD